MEQYGFAEEPAGGPSTSAAAPASPLTPRSPAPPASPPAPIASSTPLLNQQGKKGYTSKVVAILEGERAERGRDDSSRHGPAKRGRGRDHSSQRSPAKRRKFEEGECRPRLSSALQSKVLAWQEAARAVNMSHRKAAVVDREHSLAKRGKSEEGGRSSALNLKLSAWQTAARADNMSHRKAAAAVDREHSPAKRGKIRNHQRTPSGSRDFKEATKRDALARLEVELERLLASAPDARRPLMEKEFYGFKNLFSRFLAEQGPSVTWEKIQKLPEGAVIDYSSLTTPTTESIHHMLDKLVVVKLNGGLGTSMGCKGPKSVIQVRNELTFLDLTVQQIEHLNKTYKCNVPLVLMNSFNTDEDTQKVIRKYRGLKLDIHTFNQSCHPRINRESLLPIAKTADIHHDIEAWYPPGHGDFYESFHNSGLLQKFIAEGRTYCFISNIDNLGATVDLNILNLLLNPDQQASSEFVMEVTDKTRADVKGGTLIQYEDKLRLLEIAQVPKEHVDDFKSVSQFKFFNTNNLWAKLDAIRRVVERGSLNMEIIVNAKTLADGVNVIQLETAVGAAMKCFDRGVGVNVPRSRFLPVKKTSDLLLVMSNLYSLCHGSLFMSEQRMFPSTPLVKLGDNHFAKVKEFLNRFATIPDLIELDHLTVSGDVTFGRGVSLKGTVIIIANHGDRIDIPSGALLENRIVSGNLRILDH